MAKHCSCTIQLCADCPPITDNPEIDDESEFLGYN